MNTSNVIGQSESIAKFAVALVKAQATARAVEKDSQNQYHRYAYASAEAIMAEARGALVSAGLAFFCTGWHFVPRPTDATNAIAVAEKGERAEKLSIGRVVVQYRVVHESGEWMQFEASTPVIPEKGRPEDKAEATALTYGIAYFLRGLLLLPRVEEGSQVDDRRDDSQPAPPRASKELYDRYMHEVDEAKDGRTLNQLVAQITAAGFSDSDMALFRERVTKRRAEVAPKKEGASNANGAPANGGAA